MARKLPLVAVLGATACGKSKLAIELARRFGGEIISADSMQVYHGLDIVTNKVTKEEQLLAKHHMMNFLNPLHSFTVVDYRNKSLEIIETLKNKGSFPIVVGGTNYYIESLLWEKFIFLETQPTERPSGGNLDEDEPTGEDHTTILDSEVKLLRTLPRESLHSEEDLEDVEKFFKKRIYSEALHNADSEKLWKILEKVDIDIAHYVHPHEKRRIIRYLQVIQEKRRNYSELLKEANKSSQQGQESLGGPLRFEPTCVLWLSCDNSWLDEILDARVDQMLERGLLAELDNFHEQYNRQRMNNGEEPDYTKGVFQNIGFKEFHPYLILDTDLRSSEEGDKILKECILTMKSATRRYARRQVKWIRRRFLRADSRDLPPVFKLATTLDEEKWEEQVRKPAFEIVSRMLKEQPLSEEVENLRQKPERQIFASNLPGKFYCEACDRTFIGSYYINHHLESKSHSRKVGRLKHKKQRLELSEQ